MRHLIFNDKGFYKICFLVNRIQSTEIEKEYLNGLDKNDVLILDLYKDPLKKKTSVADMKEYLQEVLEICYNYGVQYICCCNSEYFKVLTKEVKADVNIGYLHKVEHFKVLYIPDYRSIFYDPVKIRAKIQRSLKALKDDLQGSYVEPGSLEIHGWYPKTNDEIFEALKSLLEIPVLTCDIETYSLRPHLAGITSIAFAKNLKEGIAFKVDFSKDEKNELTRNLLRWFFKIYKGKLIFHNIAFDATVLIYQLFMDDIFDAEGLLRGMKILLKNFEDTKLIAYLATNSCAGNELGLKTLAHEFAGNWAQEEIEDASKIPEDVLLKYNLTDCLATWYVYQKFYPQMIQDNQEEIYRNLFIPSTQDIIQMQLTGFPLNMQRVYEVEAMLQKDQETALQGLKDSQLLHNFIDVLKQEWVEKRNSELKKKKVTIEDAVNITFNPRSHPQLQRFLYEVVQLPIINWTENGFPATDAETLAALKNHTDNKEIKTILQSLVDFAAVDKILGTFIPAMKDAVYSPKMNWHFMIGSFNLGGTVSGRLTSSKPNLQQIPATGSKYAKAIKSCFQAPKGWVLCGLDFNALEDHISALTTKDQNKLKVYLDHYDGHCLRAFSYFSDKMPDIQKDLDLLNQEGKIYKVTFDDGHVQFFNEHDPEFISIRNQNALHEGS